MARRRPAETFSPGEILRDELAERGWTPAGLAGRMGQPVGIVRQIIAGERAISPETARALSAALGTSAVLWTNLDSRH
jgi:HTH-type transcriptional regulator / antitoxin HigA